MTIVFLTRDLMIQSSAAAAARLQGVTMVAAPTIERAMKKLAATSAQTLFVDLQTPGLKISELATRLAAVPDRPRVIAFAQHVEAELLELANSDVIDHVMTRGQFNNRLPTLIRQSVISTATAMDDTVSDGE